MALDPKQPVYLKKQIIDLVSGNTYPADSTRPYNLLTFPEKFRTPEYFTHEVKVPLSPLINTSIQSIAPPPLNSDVERVNPIPLIAESAIPAPVVATPPVVVAEAPAPIPATSKK